MVKHWAGGAFKTLITVLKDHERTPANERFTAYFRQKLEGARAESSAESSAVALRALNRAGVRNPEASMIAGSAQFYVHMKGEGLNAPQAAAALYRMLTTGHA